MISGKQKREIEKLEYEDAETKEAEEYPFDDPKATCDYVYFKPINQEASNDWIT